MTSTQTIVTMPALGEGVEEATITRWLKQPGDYVEIDEPLLEAATDKVDTEIPAPCAGIVDRMLVDEDDTVAIGTPLAVITITITSGAAEAPDEVPPAQPPAPMAPQEPALATPAASKTVDLPDCPAHDAEHRNGPAFDASTTSPSPAAGQARPWAGSAAEKLPGIRRTIGRRMLESLKVSAQLTTVLEADVTPILRLRAVHKDEFLRRTGTKLSYLPFFAKAAVDALSQHRMLNAELNAENTEVTYHGAVHLGIAVDGPKGLMVPVIRNAEGASVRTLATSIAAAADRVRSNSITVDELNGGTFTITNTGSRGALFDTPIINQPQTGILGVGAVVERVVSMCDQQNGLGIGIRSMVYLSLTYDHRIVDGADAARYLSAVKEHLESGFGDGDLDC